MEPVLFNNKMDSILTILLNLKELRILMQYSLILKLDIELWILIMEEG